MARACVWPSMISPAREPMCDPHSLRSPRLPRRPPLLERRWHQSLRAIPEATMPFFTATWRPRAGVRRAATPGARTGAMARGPSRPTTPLATMWVSLFVCRHSVRVAQRCPESNTCCALGRLGSFCSECPSPLPARQTVFCFSHRDLSLSSAPRHSLSCYAGEPAQRQHAQTAPARTTTYRAGRRRLASCTDKRCRVGG